MKYDLYDFDGTIYDGDSGIDMVIFAIKKYPQILPKVIHNSLLYKMNIINKNEYKSRIFSFVKYVDNMDIFINEFWKKYESKLKSFWLEKNTHDKDIIISASAIFWLQYIKDKYHVKDLIATNIDSKTGKLIGENCHGEEKVKMYYKKYGKGSIAKMYTDSLNDLPLLKEADEGFLVRKKKITNYKIK